MKEQRFRIDGHARDCKSVNLRRWYAKEEGGEFLISMCRRCRRSISVVRLDATNSASDSLAGSVIPAPAICV